MAYPRKLIKGKHLPDLSLSAYAHVITDNTLNDKSFSLVRAQTLKVYSALAVYDRAMLKAKDVPLPQFTFEKNTARSILVKALTMEMKGINFHYAGDTELMLRSGFEMSQAESRRIDINQPATHLTLDGSQPNVVKWRCDAIKDAQVVIRYRIVGSGDIYKSKFSSKARGVIAGLESGKKYEFEAVLVSRSMQDSEIYSWCQEKVWIVQ